MNRDLLHEFLINPSSWNGGASPDDHDCWLAGLQGFAAPYIGTIRDRQQKAWEGLAPHRAGLILGPPGTGKTFTLSWMASAYAVSRNAQGLPCRIFVSAFTKAAIQNVLRGIHSCLTTLGLDVPVYFLEGPDTTGDGVRHLMRRDLEGALEHKVVVIGGTDLASLFRTVGYLHRGESTCSRKEEDSRQSSKRRQSVWC